MKGITPVVAIILLLLITISMVGFAFVWFNRIATLTTEQTTTQVQNQLDTTAQKIRIDAISPISSPNAVTIRNIGSKDILVTALSVFVSGVAKTCTNPPWTGTLTVGTTLTCTFTSGTCTAGADTIKVTAPGGSDSVKC